jgi:Protein of unknown function (DUF3145)
MATRGVVYVHSAPPALCPHVEWAVEGVLGSRIAVGWTPQPAAPGTMRAEISWQAEPGTSARLTSALRGWQLLRFEVTEEPSPGCEGERYSSTPRLGIFHAMTGVHGDILIPEDRLRAVLRAAEEGGSDLAENVHQLLGTAWDEELEPFRYAGEGAPVRWLHQVG